MNDILHGDGGGAESNLTAKGDVPDDLARLALAFDSTPDALLLLDAEDRISRFNSALADLFPGSAHLLERGKPFRQLIVESAATGQLYAELPEKVEILRDGRRRRVAAPAAAKEARKGAAAIAARRLALHDLAPCDFETMTAQGRWIQIATRPTADAGKLIVYRDITTWKARALQLEHTALHDPSTGLANRILFMDRIGQELRRCARERDRSFGVMLVDLDNFRLVSSSLGPDRSDAVLAAVARRLERTVRPTDTVARLDGDAFACIVDRLRGHEEAMEFAQRIHAALEEPLRVSGTEIAIRASIGIAFGNSGTAVAQDVVHDATIALDRAKHDSVNAAAVYDQVMRSNSQTKFQLDSELRSAVRQRSLTLNYQPIIDIETSRLIGFEALARWRHERLADVAPNVFIRVAEETGLIVPLGRLAIDIAARDLASWLEHDSRLFVTVNTSPLQFDEHDLASDLAEAIGRYGLPADALHLEITESTVVENPERVADALTRIKQLGVRICIDDFGTGYSSLHLLQAMPYDVLKIDRSFVSGMTSGRRSQIILESITTLAHRMGMPVVAEGIERHDQLATVRRVGCDFAQGYLFAPPLTKEDALRLAKEGVLELERA